MVSSHILGYCQQPGFNMLKDIGFPRNRFNDLLVDNDTIICYGLAYNDSLNWQRGLLLAKYDSSGNFIKSNLILDSLGDFLSIDQYWGRMVKSYNGGYAMTAAPLGRNSALFVKVNNDLEVEYINEYKDTNYVTNYNYRLLSFEDGYFLYGSVQLSNLFEQGFVRRLDLQGNTIWLNLYGNVNFTDAILDLKVKDDTIYASSVEAVTANVFGQYITIFRKLDMSGNEIGYWESSPEPEIGAQRKFFILEDGDIFSYGEQVVGEINDIKLVKNTVSRLDKDYNVVWVKHFGRVSSIDQLLLLYEIEPTIDGNFILAGRGIQNFNGVDIQLSGWLVKFSPDGDSIWSRYDVSSVPPDINNDHYFGGVGVLSSGNIVAGGTVQDGWKYYGWLVKVTNDGCLDTLYCGLVSGVAAQIPQKTTLVNVYPNPATTYLEMDYDAKQGTLATILLTNLLGRVVGKFNFEGNNTHHVIPLHGLPNGPYFYTILQGGRQVHVGKFIKLE